MRVCVRERERGREIQNVANRTDFLAPRSRVVACTHPPQIPACVSESVSVSVSVCVCERERERERECVCACA